MVILGTECDAFVSTKSKRSRWEEAISEIREKFRRVVQNAPGTPLESTAHAAVERLEGPQRQHARFPVDISSELLQSTDVGEWHCENRRMHDGNVYLKFSRPIQPVGVTVVYLHSTVYEQPDLACLLYTSDAADE